MLTIKTLPVNLLQENCYIVSDDTKDCVIIDCGAQYQQEFRAIQQYIESNLLKPVHLLNTHLHFDHVWGNPFIRQTYGLRTEASTRDQQIYDNISQQFEQFLGANLMPDFAETIARDLDEGDEVHFGTHTFQVIATPGHTPGGICFYCPEEKVLFSGDSLFYGSIGRTDLPGGNVSSLVNSLKNKVITLPTDVQVYPGHGPATSILQEKQFNPYL